MPCVMMDDDGRSRKKVRTSQECIENNTFLGLSCDRSSLLPVVWRLPELTLSFGLNSV
jgi:hypothetical protein